MSGTPTPAPAGSARQVDLDQLRRLRWAVRAVLVLGVAASIAANVLHARPNTISQMISAWPPLALLLTVELISRVPSNRRVLAVLRLLAAAVIAGIAGWVSYWHMVGVAARYGETEAGAAYLLPISVDGLVIVASVSLVEITGRIRTRTPAPSATTAPSGPSPVAVPSTPPAPPTVAALPATAHPLRPITSAPSVKPTSRNPVARAAGTARVAAPEPVAGAGAGEHPHPGHTATGSAPARPADPISTRGAAERPTAGQPPHADDMPPDTRAAVDYWRRRDPSLHPAQIAARIGRSERTVRRHWRPPSTTSAAAVNGHRADRPRR